MRFRIFFMENIIFVLFYFFYSYETSSWFLKYDDICALDTFNLWIFLLIAQG